MKTYVFLSCIVVLAIVSSVKSDKMYHDFLNAIPEEIQTKCYAEADLVADKDKVLADEMTVDPKKLSCFTACVFKETGVMTGGNASFDILEKQLDVTMAGDPNIDTRKQIIKECLQDMTGATDCEKIGSATECIHKKIAEKGI